MNITLKSLYRYVQLLDTKCQKNRQYNKKTADLLTLYPPAKILLLKICK